MAQLGVTGLDLAIIAVYLVSVTAIGLAVRRRAARSVESYLLGDKSLPWYMLGVSNASGCSTSRARCGWSPSALSMGSRASGCRGCGRPSTRSS